MKLRFETLHEAKILVFSMSNAKNLAFGTPDANALTIPRLKVWSCFPFVPSAKPKQSKKLAKQSNGSLVSTSSYNKSYLTHSQTQLFTLKLQLQLQSLYSEFKTHPHTRTCIHLHQNLRSYHRGQPRPRLRVDGLGDFVSLSVDYSTRPGEIAITRISSNAVGKLSRNTLSNCTKIAVIEVMNILGIQSIGLSLSLEKGLPLGSGLGSSVASAAAGAIAVNELFGRKLRKEELVITELESKEKVSGYHADNVGLAIMGDFVLIRNYEPLDMKKLNFPEKKDLYLVLVIPKFETLTKKMRVALPLEIGMADFVWNLSQAVALAAFVLEGDVAGLGKVGSCEKAAIEAGAFGCTISGVGPTAVAVIDCEEKGIRIGERMVETFWREGGLKVVVALNWLDWVGARLVDSKPR
ncbi:hypothetical protein SO802_027771 [Lithocarpus litseifolius]|uniref:GHMP kinase N-terminal domain-containing protein n=1 Tax=Lithocarpus litseifolius TaxID=425828 RepID=A0AAW2BQS0_9ROSI